MVGKGMEVEHNSAQNSLATVYCLSHGFLELGRQKLRLANLTDDYGVAFLAAPDAEQRGEVQDGPGGTKDTPSLSP